MYPKVGVINDLLIPPTFWYVEFFKLTEFKSSVKRPGASPTWFEQTEPF
jgi:hypothetical protein